jgi:23S rRNA (pseudouridine1915-N3)-methyltransferase
MDWAARATSTGRSHGLGPVEIIEVEGRKHGKGAEALTLSARLEQCFVIACDEHGSALSSRDFSDLLTRLKDEGVARLVFVVGGSDGLDAAILSRADRTIAFGPQTWPHALVRAMLAEQVYRAATLMAGAPYHRD